jgi:prepilin-type N-terminal cleavage/methylation domain-containing protein
MKTKRSAFTLMEIMVVICIIGILAAMFIPLLQKVRQKNVENRRIQADVPDADFVEIGRQTINGDAYSIVKHNDTGIVYIVNYNLFTPLLDKDGKPLVKY